MSKKPDSVHLFVAAALLLLAACANAADLRVADAAEKRDHEAVRRLISERADVNARQGDGATALQWASHWNDLETAEMLIRAGASVNETNDRGVTALLLACTNGSAPMVSLLLRAGADAKHALPSGETPLMRAARTGSAETVKLLLASGADVNASEVRQGQTALMWAAAQKHSGVVSALIEGGADVHGESNGGFSALLFAARAGDLESTRLLLAAGADVNAAAHDDGDSGVTLRYQNIGAIDRAKSASAGMTPLLIASANGHEDLSIFLLERGADPNAATPDGFTALHYAIQKGASHIAAVQLDSIDARAHMFRPNMVKLAEALLAGGADPNARLTKAVRLPRSNTPRFSMLGATPFLLAAGAYDTSLMRMLAERGADPRLGTSENITPIMVAAGLGRYQDFGPGEEERALEAVKLAVELGGDVNAAGENNYTALHGAAYVGAETIIRYLVGQEARLDVRDRFDQTPLSIAQGVIGAKVVDFTKKPFGPHPKAAELLLELGATP
jgi:ankyrin repeat protein